MKPLLFASSRHHFLSTLFAAAAIAAGLAAPLAATAQTAPDIYAGLDRGVHALVVRISVRADKVDDFQRLMKARVQQSRTDPAVVDFRFFASATEPLVFHGYESFRSKEAFTAFAQNAESKAFGQALAPMLDKPLEAQFLKPLD